MTVTSVVQDSFPNLARHWSILRAAWSHQNEADAKARPVIDHEFLPAALEIIEKPPSPGLRLLTLTLCGLFALALLWSFIGQVDVVAVASGKTLPAANTKIVQPIEIGAIRAIHVRNGQHVKKGELLVELDPTLAGADRDQAAQGLLAARMGEARGDALVAYLEGRNPAFHPPEGATVEATQTQRRMIASLVSEYEAQRAGLVQSRAEKAAELAGSTAEVAKLEQTLPLVRKQLEARKELTEKGYFSTIRLLEYEQLVIEHARNIDVQRSNAAKARAAIGNIDAQLAALRASFGKTAVTGLSEAEDQSAIRVEELRKSERRRSFQQIRSPVDGTVQQLAVTTIGGIVQPAQALMVVVPDGSEVEVEAQILNRDIGFVREGQAVRVKLEAFPFTDYGVIDGVVETISRDAIESPQAVENRKPGEASRTASQGLVYACRIRLRRRWIEIAGQTRPIGAGLAVQAEIKTGERRIIDYLLSPIAKSLDEAGRER